MLHVTFMSECAVNNVFYDHLYIQQHLNSP